MKRVITCLVSILIYTLAVSINPAQAQEPSNGARVKRIVLDKLLIHELTHAWQIAHTSFLPGLVCEGLVNQANNTVGQSVYVYGRPGPNWSTGFNLEQQAAIVDQWFGGTPTVVVPNRKAKDENDPYFAYIRDNIRANRS